jgi:hypothetical protein
MKYTFQWILVAVCLFVVGTAQVMGDDGDDEKISVPIGTGDIYTGNDAKDVITVPFVAYYQGGTIYISSSAEFPVISVAVVNGTTGQIWSTTTDISDGMGEICIANGGAGSYTVEIVTEYGECFVGDFEL